MNKPQDTDALSLGMEKAEKVPFRDCDGYDHNCVTCDLMADIDMDTKYIGEKGTCCVCVEHGCEEARREREIHPKNIQEMRRANQQKSNVLI